MRKCPKCEKWTLDFDEYFGRFRCFDPECGWMPPSSAERQIRLLRSHTQPTRLEAVNIPELELTLTPSYDPENDAFSVDFGLDEPTFDLPEPDGRMIWRIGWRSDTVAGFTIVRVREGAIAEITIQFIYYIARRKEDIERRLRKIPGALGRGRVTKDLLDEIVVTAVSDEATTPAEDSQVEDALKRVVDGLQQELTNLQAP